MIMLNRAYSLLSFALFLILIINVVYSSEQVTIIFLYWDPSTDGDCPTCDVWIALYEDFLEKNDTINRIQNEADDVVIKWIEYYSTEGVRERVKYGVNAPNSIVIIDGEGNFTRVIGDFNETYIREVIDAYLAESEPPSPSSPPPLIPVLGLAFSFGFFETFSPCLIILLSFVLSYTVGETTRFKEGLLRVMTFGIGFVSASMLVLFGLAVGLIIISSMLMVQNFLMWVICVFAILFGIDLLGINVFKFIKVKVETKPLIQKLARKSASTYIGLITLGFIFYFLDPCLAPIFALMITTFQPTLLLEFLPLILLTFCFGVLIPFIGIGVIAGSISKLARSTYRHRSKIRAISGLILILYTLYIIVFYLLL
ncbi:hypothetical protein DRO69_02330 [Candidatus Bathyarchaeota archaeon]|nr:MAG: hypothetical protein DRO69_02330 [Candidatus Bathyarchaeota archaeon]